MTDLNALVTKYIGRVVAFILTPVLLPAAAVVAVWAQDKLGLDLDPAVLTGYVVSVVSGIALVVWAWLRNRGAWELAEAQKVPVGGVTNVTATGTTFYKPPQ